MQKISNITSEQDKPLVDDNGSLLSKIEEVLLKKKGKKVKYLEQAEVILHQIINVCKNEEDPSLSVSNNTTPYVSNNHLIIIEKEIAPTPIQSDKHEGAMKKSNINNAYSPQSLNVEKANNNPERDETIMNADESHQTLVNYNKYQAIKSPHIMNNSHLTLDKGMTPSLAQNGKHERATKDSYINNAYSPQSLNIEKAGEPERSETIMDADGSHQTQSDKHEGATKDRIINNSYSRQSLNVEKVGEESNNPEQYGTIMDDENGNSKSITLYHTQANNNAPMNEEHTGENFNLLRGNNSHLKNEINRNTEEKSEKFTYHFKQWAGKHSVMINKYSEGLVLKPSDTLVEKRLTNALDNNTNTNKWEGNKNGHEKHNDRNESNDKDLD